MVAANGAALGATQLWRTADYRYSKSLCHLLKSQRRKDMAKTKGKSKKELLIEQIAIAVGAGREVAVETVDFSDPNRPKTCLEVDFPIIPINQIANIEGNAR